MCTGKIISISINKCVQYSGIFASHNITCKNCKSHQSSSGLPVWSMWFVTYKAHDIIENNKPKCNKHSKSKQVTIVTMKVSDKWRVHVPEAGVCRASCWVWRSCNAVWTQPIWVELLYHDQIVLFSFLSVINTWNKVLDSCHVLWPYCTSFRDHAERFLESLDPRSMLILSLKHHNTVYHLKKTCIVPPTLNGHNAVIITSNKLNTT